MVVLAVGDEGQRVDESDGAVIVVEPEGLAQCVAVLDQFPAGNFRQQFAYSGLGKLVFAAAGRRGGVGDAV